MSIELEILVRPANGHGGTLVFVHGSCSQAAMWQPMMEWFSSQGVPSLAISLRGHGSSGGHLASATIEDYVDDVASVCERHADRRIVLVGHSMGGFIIQLLLGRRDKPSIAAAVLLAPGPSRTMRREAVRMMIKRPLNFLRATAMRDIRRVYDGPGLRDFLLHPAASPDTVSAVRKAIQPESWIAAAAMNRKHPDWERGRGALPILVVSGSEDNMVSPEASRQTAADWRAEYIEFPGMSHMLPVEPGWEALASKTLQWLRSQSLAH